MRNIDYSLVSKVTERCNVDCGYCYLDSKKDSDMSEKIAENLIKDLLKINKNFAHFTWIGGEPLIRKNSFFEDIIHFSNKHNKNNLKVSHSIQTNGIFLNQKRFKDLKKMGFKIGVSYDGTLELQSNRIGKENAKKVMENIQRERGKLGIVGVLTKNSVGNESEIYNFLRENTTFARLNFYAPTGEGLTLKNELLPSKKEAKEMLLSFYNLWINDDSNLELRPHKEIVRSFFTGIPLNCEYSAVSCYRILSSDSRGDIYSCSRATHIPELMIGNVVDGLEELIGNEIHSKPLKRYMELKRKTKDKWFVLSSGGCPIEALSHKRDYMSETYYSGEIRNALFDKMDEDLKDERTRKKLEGKAGLIK